MEEPYAGSASGLKVLLYAIVPEHDFTPVTMLSSLADGAGSPILESSNDLLLAGQWMFVPGSRNRQKPVASRREEA